MEFVVPEKEREQEQKEIFVAERPLSDEVIDIKDETAVFKTEQHKRPFSKRGRPSLKEIETTANLVQIPPDEILFQKQYYSIGEVAQWFHVNQSLVRYWETEFDIL